MVAGERGARRRRWGGGRRTRSRGRHSRSVPLAPGPGTPSSFRVVLVPASAGRQAGKQGLRAVREAVERSGERTTRVPEVSGGYSVITVPSREPTNQTKRDKDKQRFEPTSSGGGKNKAEAH